jgi:hypothetical protein
MALAKRKRKSADEKLAQQVVREVKSRPVASSKYMTKPPKYVETVWREVHDGSSVRLVRAERIARGDIRKILDESLDAWLCGDVAAFEVTEGGNNAAKTRIWHYYDAYRNADDPRIDYRPKEMPLEKRHINSLIYHTHSLDGEEVVWETGEPVDPFVQIGCGDGTFAFVPAILPDDMDPDQPIDNGWGGEPARKVEVVKEVG